MKVGTSLALRAYKAIPFKMQFFNLARGRYTPPPKARYFLRPVGAFDVSVGGSTFRMFSHGERNEADLYWCGWGNGWEATSLKLWQALVPGARTIFDVGAYTGMFALGAKALNRSADVHAFEPLRRNFERLAQNVSLNEFTVIAQEAAVSDEDGTVTFWASTDENAKSSSIEQSKLDHGTIPVEVNKVAMESYCEKNKIAWPDLLKIDVELHEPAVFRGMGRILTDRRPPMIVEVLRPAVAAELTQIITGLGYEIYMIDEKRGLTRSEVVRSHGGGNYNVLLCQPEISQRIGIEQFMVR